MARSADPPEQQVLRRNPWFVLVPSALLVVLLLMLVWEIVLVNLSVEQKARLPFHVTFLGISSAASAAGLFAGLLLARGQFARSVRPVVGWTGSWATSGAGGDQLWVVSVHNGGSGLGTVRQTEYRVSAAGSDPSTMTWSGFEEARAKLQSLGLKSGRDFALIQLGVGHPLVSSTKPRDGYTIFTLNEAALEHVHAVDMRITVVDIVGDRHRRYLELLKAAQSELIPSVDHGPAAAVASNDANSELLP